MLIVVGRPVITEEEMAYHGYYDPLIMGPIRHSDQRDIPALLVEQGFFASKRLAREGTPPALHRTYAADELDILEWNRKNPWPLGIDIIVGYG